MHKRFGMVAVLFLLCVGASSTAYSQTNEDLSVSLTIDMCKRDVAQQMREKHLVVTSHTEQDVATQTFMRLSQACFDQYWNTPEHTLWVEVVYGSDHNVHFMVMSKKS